MGTPPLDRSTIWPYEDGEPGEFYYSRYGNPTQAAAERALGELEGGEALLFASGTGATTAVVLAFLEPGATIALAEGAYYGTSVLFRELERWGLRFVEFDQTGAPPDGVDLVWLEAPSNPFLTMPDLDAAAGHPAPRARRRDRLDARLPARARARRRLRPPLGDEVPAGHHDVLLGAVVCQRPEDARTPARVRGRTGITAPRARRGSSTAACTRSRCGCAATPRPRPRSPKRLGGHEAVERVRYPGFGGLLSFDVAGGADAARRRDGRRA